MFTIQKGTDKRLVGLLSLGTGLTLTELADGTPEIGTATVNPALDDLTDVVITTPSAGPPAHYLKYNGTNWVNGAIASADLPSHTHSAADITSSNLAYARLPSGGGTWANGGALSITGGITTVAGLTSTDGLRVGGGTLAYTADEIRLTKTGQSTGLRLASTGGADSYVIDVTAALGALHFQTQGVSRWVVSSVALLTNIDNTYDLGASGATRPRTGYFGTSLVTPAVYSAASQALNLGDALTNRWQIAVGGHFIAITDNTNDFGQSAANRPRTGYFGTSLITPVVNSPAATALTLGAAGTSRWFIATTGEFLASVDNTSDIGASGASRPRVGYFGTSLIVGTDPGGAENLRVGTSARIGNTTGPAGGALVISNTAASLSNIVQGAGGRIDNILWDTSAAADERRVDTFSLNGVAGANSFIIGVTRTDAGTAGNQLIRAFRTGNAWTSLRLLDNGTGFVQIGNSTGAVLVQTDPGGSELFRVGSTTRLAGTTTISTGDLIATNGRLIFGAASAKILLGATSLLWRDSTDAATIMQLTVGGALALTGSLNELLLNARSGGGNPWELYAPTTTDFRLYHAADQYVFSDTAFTQAGTAKTIGTSGTRWGKLWGQDADFSTTVLVSGDLTAGARLVFTTAVSKIVPGATSQSLRNNADNADNILVADAGAVTFRSTVGGITTLTATTLAGTLSTAAQANVTSLGTLTGLTIAGNLTFSGASRRIIAGTTDWALRDNANANSNLLMTDAGIATLRNDLIISSLGTFQSTVAPTADQLLSYSNTVSKWVPRTIQMSFATGNVGSSLLGDNTVAAYVAGAPAGGSQGGTPSTPTTTALYKAIRVTLPTTLPANCVYVVDYSTNGGGFTTNAIITIANQIVHGALNPASTYSYKYLIRGAGDTAYSTASSALNPSNVAEVNAFGVILASQITAPSLSSIVANIGTIIAGQIQDASTPTRQIRISGGTDPDLVDGMQSYIDFQTTSNFMRLGRSPLDIVSSTNATPIVVTVNGHGLQTGDAIAIRGHLTNTAANSSLWIITVLDEDTFSLDTSAGNGVGGTTGHVVQLSMVVSPTGALSIYGSILANSLIVGGSSTLSGMATFEGGALFRDLQHSITGTFDDTTVNRVRLTNNDVRVYGDAGTGTNNETVRIGSFSTAGAVTARTTASQGTAKGWTDPDGTSNGINTTSTSTGYRETPAAGRLWCRVSTSLGSDTNVDAYDNNYTLTFKVTASGNGTATVNILYSTDGGSNYALLPGNYSVSISSGSPQTQTFGPTVVVTGTPSQLRFQLRLGVSNSPGGVGCAGTVQVFDTVWLTNTYEVTWSTASSPHARRGLKLFGTYDSGTPMPHAFLEPVTTAPAVADGIPGELWMQTVSSKTALAYNDGTKVQVLRDLSTTPWVALNKTTTSTSANAVVISFSIPANTLDTNGTGLRIVASGVCGVTSANPISITFGGTVIYTQNHANTTVFWICIEVFRSSSNNQAYFTVSSNGTTVKATTQGTATETDTATITMDFRCSQAGAGTFTYRTISIEKLVPDTVS